MKTINVYNNGVDSGWIGSNQRWWFDPNHPDSFELFDLDGFYPEQYFASDHVDQDSIKKYVYYVTSTYESMIGRPPSSILEVGAGGGWFTKAFIESGYDILALEGTTSGYNRCIDRGIPPSIILKHDLRKQFDAGRRFDIVLCTEVAEHIETPFSSQLIKTLADHSDFIWFSFEQPDTNSAHYHHCNEQPEKFWVNLFDFYGYGFIPLDKKVQDACAHRGTHIFYNTQSYKTL